VTDEAFEGNYYTGLNTTVTAILPKDATIDYWLINDEKAEGDEIVITGSMVKDGKVDVYCITE
jgi:hypothetical protein